MATFNCKRDVGKVSRSVIYGLLELDVFFLASHPVILSRLSLLLLLLLMPKTQTNFSTCSDPSLSFFHKQHKYCTDGQEVGTH